MTNTIIRRALRPLGRKTPEQQAAEVYEHLGWEDLGPWGTQDSYESSCPECGQIRVTSVLQTWENVETDDYTYVDLFWCVNRHMWAKVETSRERARFL